MKRLLSLLAALACLLAVAMPAQAASAKKPQATELEKVQAYVGPSIVNLQIDWSAYVYDKTNKNIMKDVRGSGNIQEFTATFQCTGYVVNPNGYIATAGHCVDPNQVREYFFDQAALWAAQCACYYNSTTLSADQIRAFSDAWVLKHYDEASDSVKNNALREKVEAAWSISAGGVEVGKAQPARVVKYQSFKDGDGALLKVEASGLPALPLIEGEPKIGSKVVAVGFPGSVDDVTDADLEPSYKDGSLGSKSTEDDGLTTVYEISAATSGGMSGGPVVNDEGEVLGFVDFKNSTETQAFNFMRPASTIKELSVSGSENTLDANAKAYRAGLTAYFNGNRTAAVSNLSKVVDDQPTNKFAKEYLDKAKKLPIPPKKSSFPVLPVVIGLIVLLLIGAVVAFLLMRKGKKPGSGTPAGMAYPPAGQPGAPAPGAPGAPQPPATPVGVGAPAAPAPAPTQPAQPQQSDSAPTAPLGFTPPPPAPAPAPGPESGPSAQAGPVAPQSSPQAGAGFCSNCGARHEPGTKFCANCGAAQ